MRPKHYKKREKKEQETLGTPAPISTETPVVDVEQKRENLEEQYAIDRETVETEQTVRRTRKQVQAELDALKDAQAEASGFNKIGVFALDALCQRMPKPKPLTDTEREMFEATFMPLCVKYFGSIKWQEEIGFAVAMVVIIAGRVNFETKKKESMFIETVQPIIPTVEQGATS